MKSIDENGQEIHGQTEYLKLSEKTVRESAEA